MSVGVKRCQKLSTDTKKRPAHPHHSMVQCEALFSLRSVVLPVALLLSLALLEGLDGHREQATLVVRDHGLWKRVHGEPPMAVILSSVAVDLDEEDGCQEVPTLLLWNVEKPDLLVLDDVRAELATKPTEHVLVRFARSKSRSWGMPLPWVGCVIERTTTKEDIKPPIVTSSHRDVLAGDRDGHLGNGIEQRSPEGLTRVDMPKQLRDDELELLVVGSCESGDGGHSGLDFHGILHMRCRSLSLQSRHSIHHILTNTLPSLHRRKDQLQRMT